MTLKEFFAKLPGERWSMTESGILKRQVETEEGDIVDCCPVTSVAPIPLSRYRIAEAEMMVRLPGVLVDRIIMAADNRAHGRTHPENHAELRRRLLAHCGLTETARV